MIIFISDLNLIEDDLHYANSAVDDKETELLLLKAELEEANAHRTMNCAIKYWKEQVDTERHRTEDQKRLLARMTENLRTNIKDN